MNIGSDDKCVLREWLSLQYITNLIPNKVRKGLILQDVQFTCIDAANEFIAIGTNVGVVFWCNRITLKVTPYKPGKRDFGITCLKLVESVDYMLAVGDKLGIISIFKIPKELPKDLPEEYLKRYDNKTELFTVGGIHKTQITSLEWSLNGEKLFSGDIDGVVGFTQMDFYMNLTKSCEILKEGYRIVQLSFQNNQILLVSSLLRSVILFKNENWKVIQIGQKDRKTLAELGAVFNNKSGTSASPPLIYATRHGQRIWIADTSGMVQKTLLFKDLLSSPHIPRIKHLNSYDGILSCENFEFSTLQVFHSQYLVSHSSNILVVINHDTSAVVGVLRSYAGIQGLAVSRDEIFLLEGSRGLRRLSFVQDPFVARQKASESDVLGEAMLDLAVKLKDAASVIAPLLKDYTEASPITRLNSPEVDYDVGIAEENGEAKTLETEKNLVVRTFEGQINKAFGPVVKGGEEVLTSTVAKNNDASSVSEDKNSISKVIQDKYLSSTVSQDKDSIPIVIEDKTSTSTIAQDDVASTSTMIQDKDLTSTVAQKIQYSAPTSTQNDISTFTHECSISAVSQDELGSTISATNNENRTSTLLQDHQASISLLTQSNQDSTQKSKQQEMPPTSLDLSTTVIIDQKNRSTNGTSNEFQDSPLKKTTDPNHPTVETTMLGSNNGVSANAETTRKVVIVRYFKRPPGTQPSIEPQMKRVEEPEMKMIKTPPIKPIEESSKERCLPAKTRQSILQEIGSKEYGDLVFKSSRKIRKSGKGARKKSIPTSLIGEASGSTIDLDSDTASVLSEVDMMTVSQTSSTGDFENSKPDSFKGTLTNEELEVQVAKMLSLEDVLINPSPLKTAPVVCEDDSRLTLNFVNTCNGSSSSDLTNVDSVQPTPIAETATQSPIPVNEAIQMDESVVLNFNLDHFGVSEQARNVMKSDISIASTSNNDGSAEVDSDKITVDEVKSTIVCKYENNSKLESSEHGPKRSPEKISVTNGSNIDSALQKIACNRIRHNMPNKANVETNAQILSETINNEPDSTDNAVANIPNSKFDDTLIKDVSFDSEIPNLVIITKDLQELDTPVERTKDTNNGGISDDITDKSDDTLHKSDSLSKNLPDLISCVDDSNSGSNGEQSCGYEYRSETSNSKGYLSLVGQSWHCCTTPNTCVWLGVSCHKVYCGGPRLSVYEADLRQSSLEWNLMDQKATLMTVSPCGRYIWRSNLGVVSSQATSTGNDWQVCARDVDSISLTSALAWYTSRGKVYIQVLPQSVPTLVPCSLHIVRVVSSEDRVWGLSDQGKILSRENIIPGKNPKGDSWSNIPVPPEITISDIALTHNGLGWIIDRSNYIHFYLPSPPSSPVVMKVPNFTLLPSKSDSSSGGGEWWQLLIDGNFTHETVHTASAQKPCIRSVPGSLWISHPLASVVYVSTSSVQGHRWSTLELGPLDPVGQSVGETKGSLKDTSPSAVKWKKISAEGLFEDDGYIWLLSSTGALYNYCPYSRKLSEVASPVEDDEDQIVSIEASPNALWVLTEKSDIYIRLGISTVHSTGLAWKKLPLEQFTTSHVTVADVSCACDIVWVCSTRGEVYMTLYPPHEDREQIPAWIQAEGSALPGCTFSKIYVGPHAGMVWALDNRSNVYVREGIYHDYQLGVNWLYVPGLQATHLSISQSSVWALSRDTVYKRVGVSETNFIGSYWQKVPGRVSLLSSSLNDQVYGAVTRVVRHSCVTVRVEGVEEGSRGGVGEWELL